MIGVSKLYCGTVEASDPLRYGRKTKKLPSHLLQFAADKKPIVVWNCTRRCNLKCKHCYAQAEDKDYSGELTTEEGKRLIEDLAQFGCPVLLFSGGEPLVRKDVFELAAYAVEKGLRVVFSTNGTLITPEVARRLKEIGASYIGISLDGTEAVHDQFRGVPGAFKKAIDGVRNCKQEGLKVGLRFTIFKGNAQEVGAIFDIAEQEEIDRVCFYHLVYSGRGSALIKEDLTHEETRQVVDLIIDRTYDLFKRGKPKEVLTVDNHADGPYIYLRMLKENNPRAAEVLELLKMNEGNSSGVGIGCVSWDGEVYADQFWREHSFGNVRKRPFSEIWMDTSNPLMAKLKEKKKYVKGRCSKCKWLDVCAGNFRARAEAYYGDIWAPDPACYLTDEEIGLVSSGG
ncbi:MAG: 12,18-didecarboxysiroheme deacetylase [Candidatus Desulfofervidaceae bacterium]|nr:12,18-didecarboxysiroheme deacetylase [Candidatus Desulfofervidaceae bacterium]MDL1971585.1 12,18-didecarboxysiroheme deacetylase [Candidatus Desulfofervidaceae bacterium]